MCVTLSSRIFRVKKKKKISKSSEKEDNLFCFLSCLSQFEFLSLSFSLPHKNLCFTFCFQGFHFDLVSLIHKYGILTHGSVLNLKEEKRKIWSLLLESWLLFGNLYSSFLISLGYCFWVSLKVTNFSIY